jgi:phytoene dehydrogenase-like protein
MEQFDAAIIGGGHNGLVCGAYLARAGHSVCVLERRSNLGGAAATEELWPGYRVNTAAHMLGLLQPRIIRDLELRDFGFEVLPAPPSIQFLDGVGPVRNWGRDVEKMTAEIARFSRADADAYPGFVAHLQALGPIFRQLLWEIPSTPSDLSVRGLIAKAGFLYRNRGLLTHARDVTDLMTMNANDYLSRWFESDATRTILGYYPSAGAGQSVGIDTPGTAFFLMRPFFLEPDPSAGGTGLVKGGMGMVAEAIHASAKRFGLRARTDATVERIIVDGGRAVGVILADGGEIRARAIVANAAVSHVFKDLANGADVPADYRKTVTGLRGAATSFKVHLAVEGRPLLKGVEETPVQLTVAPSMAYLERAYADMLSGELSSQPYMTVQIPTLVDPGLAPNGHHVLSIYGGHLPRLRPDDDAERVRDAVFARVVETIEHYFPAIGSTIRHRHVMLPVDYETQFGLPGGSPHHSDMTLDQLFFRRPAYGYADYTTPLDGLFLCGASAHPGGGVTGVPGHNAARIVARALRRNTRPTRPV